MSNRVQDVIRDEILAAFGRHQAWLPLAMRNVNSITRRSQLGSLWLVLSAAIFIALLSSVYSLVFEVSIDELLPHITVGYVMWLFISSVISAAPNTFQNFTVYIQATDLPLAVYALASATQLSLVFSYQFIVIVGMALIFQTGLHLSLIMVIPAMGLLYLTSVAVIMVLGIVGIRYRDIAQIVNSFLLAFFLITPILWKPSFIQGRSAFVELNPFYHAIHIVRAPILDGTVPWGSFAIMMGLCALAWLITILVVFKYRNRVVFWI